MPSSSRPGYSMTRKELAYAVWSLLYEQGFDRPIDEGYIGKLERGDIRWPNNDYRAGLRSVLSADTDAELGFTPPMPAAHDSQLVEIDQARRAAHFFEQRERGTVAPWLGRRRPLVDPPKLTLEELDDLRVIGTEVSPSIAATMDDVDRRLFLTGGAALAVSSSTAAAALVDAITRSRTPSLVGRTEIDQLLEATSLFQRFDHEHGGGFARAAAFAHLRAAADLLNARCPGRLRGGLLSAVGHLADNCGFMAFDDGDHRAARRLFNAALTCTEEAADWHLQASVLVNMTRQALWLGLPNEALALTERALSHGHQITATERATVWATRAGAHAQRGDEPAARAAIAAADDHFDRSNPEDDPPWMYYYTAAEHASSTGHALYDLVAATGGESVEATGRQRDALASFPDDEARSRALSGARLAILLMRTGDPDEAAQVGLAAVKATGPLRSRRTREYIDVLSRVSVPHSHRPPVAELRELSAAVV